MSVLWMASVKIKDLHRAWRGLQAGELKVGFYRAVEWYCASPLQRTPKHDHAGLSKPAASKQRQHLRG